MYLFNSSLLSIKSAPQSCHPHSWNIKLIPRTKTKVSYWSVTSALSVASTVSSHLPNTKYYVLENKMEIQLTSILYETHFP